MAKIVEIKKNVAAYRLKISLLYLEPPIWRLVQVPAEMTLANLHEVIQLCMGWTDSHLHQFVVGDNFYAPSDLDDDWSQVKMLDEGKYKLCDLEAEMQNRFIYEYDFGDGWQHEIKIEKVIHPEKNPSGYPVLMAGERACPPEDIGGPPGYENFLAALSDPENEDHREMLDWYGTESFDPDYFEMDGINKILKKMK